MQCAIDGESTNTTVEDADGKIGHEVSTARVSGWVKLAAMWNDTDVPLGYLITFRCYGTWLHGDERGAIDRFHNRYKAPYLARSDRRRELNERKLKSDSLLLN